MGHTAPAAGEAGHSRTAPLGFSKIWMGFIIAEAGGGWWLGGDFEFMMRLVPFVFLHFHED